MPSFDVVSEVDMMEVKNALEQANKELANRFDFRDAKAEIKLEKESINLSAIQPVQDHRAGGNRARQAGAP